MRLNAVLLVVSALLLGACSTARTTCGEIQSGRYRVDDSWLLKRIDPASAAANTRSFSYLMQQYKTGDEIWVYQAPDLFPRYTEAMRPVASGAADGRYSTVDGRYAYGQPYSLGRGYVLLRDCKAVYVIPSSGQLLR